MCNICTNLLIYVLQIWYVAGTKLNDQRYPQNEDIIELQDLRLSPIASIRNRHNSKPNSTIPFGEFDSAKFPPSFRISRPAGYSLNPRIPGLRFRGTKGEITKRV